MYDAVHLFAKALHDLDTSQQIDIKPLSCESTDTWPHGYSLINYMKIVSISATIWYAKNQSKHRQPKLCRMKIDWTCATNLIFPLLFHLLVQEKSGVVFPRLFDGKDVQRASALYTMSREKGGERKFHWCLNSIAISLEKLQLKTSGTMVRGNDVRVTMTFRWEPMT